MSGRKARRLEKKTESLDKSSQVFAEKKERSVGSLDKSSQSRKNEVQIVLIILANQKERSVDSLDKSLHDFAK